RELVETVDEASGGRTNLFIQIIDFLAVKRRPEPAKSFSRFLKIASHHREALAELTNDDSCFFSSRGRHTRCYRDWSSDVCSSDLHEPDDHFTPREVIRLMVSLLLIHDDKLLATPGTVRKLLDPACGTGGMLAEAQNYLREHHSAARLYVYGQDYNKRAFATAASDMLMKQVDHNGGGDNVRFGDSFTDDQFTIETFDYLLANPPFGVDWKKQQKEIQREHDKLGFAGRSGAGTPRDNDGALLFLQHMLSKFEPVLPDQHKHGSRLAIVFSGSPLFTGGAGSGESDIRKWIIEHDWLEAILAL